MKSSWNQSDVDPLLGIGLTKNQAAIYLSVLRHGLITATELSRITGINRQQVYADTEKLIGYGLLDITRRQRKKFIAADPRALASLAQKRVSDAQAASTKLTSVLPYLDSLRGEDPGRRFGVKYFEGMRRIRDAYSQELDACRDLQVLSFVGSVDDLYKFFPETFWKKWNERFVKQGNTSKMLVHFSDIAKETAKHDTKYRRESKHISPFPLKVNIDVFANTVLVVSVYDELAIWIDSAIIAESYRILFQTCWKHAEKF